MADDYISLRCKPEIKKAAEKAAEQESRTMSNYIIKLIRDDLTKKNIKMED